MKLKAIAVSKTEAPEKIITIVSTKAQANEYIIKVLFNEYKEHFTQWCSLRNYDVNAKESWELYFKTVIPMEAKSKFLITNLRYNEADLLAILRMFSHCQPLGCSYDTLLEYNYIANNIKIAQTLEATFKDAFIEFLNSNSEEVVIKEDNELKDSNIC
jgi:hypothetical protein